MESDFNHIKSAMETLIECQSLREKISKLPNCVYRQSLLDIINGILDNPFKREERPSRADLPPYDRNDAESVIRHLQLIIEVEGIDGHVHSNSDRSKYEKAMKDLWLSLSTITSLIDKGSLSLG